MVPTDGLRPHADPAHAGSSLAAVEHCLARIDALDAQLRVSITVLAETARARATQCDEATAQGRWLGLLHGVPLALKDNLAMAGIRTTSGSSYDRDLVPTEDAVVVQRLLAAGAVPVVKVNMAEFALGATTQNVHWGSCRTPWDPERVPGGSSGGSGAAVAAEMAHIALGTDTGASVRLPGHCNGVVGLRPTFGRVPNRGTTPCAPTLDTVGPLAHRVEDVARVLAVLQGHDPVDVSSQAGPLDDVMGQLQRGVEGLRIGVPEAWIAAGTEDAEVLATVRTALDVLAGLGADIVPVMLPGAEDSQRMAQRIIFTALAHHLRDRLASEPEGLGPDLRAGLGRFGTGTSGVDYAEAVLWNQRWRHSVDQVLVDVDLIATPTAPVIAPRVDELETHAVGSSLVRFTNGFSMAGVPGLGAVRVRARHAGRAAAHRSSLGGRHGPAGRRRLPGCDHLAHAATRAAPLRPRPASPDLSGPLS